MKLIDKIIAPLIFDKNGLEEIARDTEDTILAMIFIGVIVMIESVAKLFGQAFITQLVSSSYLSASEIMNVVLRFVILTVLMLYLSGGITIASWIFGGRVQIMNTFRLMAFSSIWFSLAIIVNLLQASELAGVFMLLMVLTFALGHGGSSNSGSWVALLSLVLGFVICFLIVVGIFRIVFWITGIG